MSVSVIHRITRKNRYLANVAYDVTMCFCIYEACDVHYWNTVSIRKIVVLKMYLKIHYYRS